MILLRLFCEFFKAGLFAVGGGLATLPFLQEMSTSTGWFTTAQLADMIAVSESTPGPIGVNMATYVGYTTAGVPGAVIASLGLVTPSIIVILIVSAFLQAFRTNKYVERAFYGLRPASTGLIAAACLSVAMMTFFKNSSVLASVHLPAVGLAAVLLYLTRWCRKTKKFHPLVFIAFSALVGIVLKF